MSTGYAIQSTLEIIGFILLVLGVIFEDRIAEMEQRLFKRISRRFKKNAKIIPLDRRSNSDRAI